MNKRVLVLLTGGTLAMTPSLESGVLEPHDFGAQLSATLPELATIAAVETSTLMLLDSSELGPVEWMAIANVIRERYLEFDGFVVVHGTDTMAYSASALSFMLPSLSKPVVFTGSQRPIYEPRSDARINLVDAVTVATMAFPEVTICMHSLLLRGNRARKRSTMAYTAFESPNMPPLARLGVTIEQDAPSLPARGVPGLPLPRPLPLDDAVALLFLTPATRAADIEQLAERNTHGLVLLAFGSGNLPLRRSLVTALHRLAIPCVVLTQCYEGAVDLGRYRGGQALLESGAIDGGDMTPEAALTKMMVALGQQLALDKLAFYMTHPVAGERRPWVNKS
jgi:L-asparaginase